MRFVHTVGRLLLGLALTFSAWPQAITTVAGNSTWGQVYNVTVDAAGNIYAADFTKHVHVVTTDEAGLRRAAPHVAAMATAEGLAAHADSVLLRVAMIVRGVVVFMHAAARR